MSRIGFLHECRIRWSKLAGGFDSTAMRVALLASYTINPLVPYLGLEMHNSGVPAKFTIGPFDQIVQICTDKDGELERLSPDALVVAPRVKDMLHPGMIVPGKELASLLREIAFAALRAADRWNAQLAVICPPAADLSAEEKTYSRDCVAALVDAVSGRPGVEVVKYDDIIAAIGEARSYHPALFSYARIPYREIVYAMLAERLAPVLSQTSVLGAPCLLLVEVEPLLSALGRGSSTAMTALLRALCVFRQSGGRLAMLADLRPGATGLESAEFLAEMDSLADCWLSSGSPETQTACLASCLGASVGELHQLTAEGAPMRDYGVRYVYRMPSDKSGWPAAAARMLDDLLPRTRRRLLSVYDYDDGPVSLEQYLSSLQLRVSCDPAKSEDTASLAALVSRCVEFGLGAIPTQEELTAVIGTQGHIVWSVAVRDRTGDYGHSGFVHFSFDGEACIVHSFSLSCTVLGRGVEDVVLGEVRHWAEAASCGRIVVRLCRTARNEPAAIFWSRSARGDGPRSSPVIGLEIEEV